MTTVTVRSMKGTYYTVMRDGDGYGNPAVTTMSCTILAGYVTNKTDCNDSSASIHPGAVETANGIDDDCNGQIDEGITSTPNAVITLSGPPNICTGSSVSLQASAGPDYSYQWKKSGVIIPGATQRQYNASQAGAYSVIVTNGNGVSATSVKWLLQLLLHPLSHRSRGTIDILCRQKCFTQGKYRYRLYLSMEKSRCQHPQRDSIQLYGNGSRCLFRIGYKCHRLFRNVC